MTSGQFADIREQTALAEEKPWSVKGLTLYPLKMRDYGAWLESKDALLLRQSTLPAVWAAMPYISALFAMEMQGLLEGQPVGILVKFIRVLCLALRLGADNASKCVRFATDPDDPRKLRTISVYGLQEVQSQAMASNDKSVRLDISRFGEPVSVKDGELPTCQIEGETFKIGEDAEILGFSAWTGFVIDVTYTAVSENPIAILKPNDFNQIRKALLAMNGEQIPDESENPELLRALAEKAQQNAPQLNIQYGDLLASVAYASHIRVKDLLDWSVYEFEMRRRAIDRDKKYMVYGTGEMSGMVSWKNGNPYPSWCFDREEDAGSLFVSESAAISKYSQAGDVR